MAFIYRFSIENVPNRTVNFVHRPRITRILCLKVIITVRMVRNGVAAFALGNELSSAEVRLSVSESILSVVFPCCSQMRLRTACAPGLCRITKVWKPTKNLRDSTPLNSIIPHQTQPNGPERNFIEQNSIKRTDEQTNKRNQTACEVECTCVWRKYWLRLPSPLDPMHRLCNSWRDLVPQEQYTDEESRACDERA